MIDNRNELCHIKNEYYLTFNYIGGQGLKGPVERLQNALSFNYYGNTEMYDNIFMGELKSETIEIHNLEKIHSDLDYDKVDINIKDNEIVIYWSFDMSTNKFGIENFYVTIKNASGSFMVDILDDNYDVIGKVGVDITGIDKDNPRTEIRIKEIK